MVARWVGGWGVGSHGPQRTRTTTAETTAGGGGVLYPPTHTQSHARARATVATTLVKRLGGLDVDRTVVWARWSKRLSFFLLFFCVGDTVILTLSSPRHCHRRHDTLVTSLSRSMPTRRVAHVSLTRSSASVHLTTRVPPPPIFRFFLLFQEVEDEKCLDWAKGMNKRTLSVLGDPTKNPIHDRVCSTPFLLRVRTLFPLACPSPFRPPSMIHDACPPTDRARGLPSLSPSSTNEDASPRGHLCLCRGHLSQCHLRLSNGHCVGADQAIRRRGVCVCRCICLCLCVHLQEVSGVEPLTCVRACSRTPQVLAALNSKDKIPYVSEVGGKFYNLWQDEKNKVSGSFF